MHMPFAATGPPPQRPPPHAGLLRFFASSQSMGVDADVDCGFEVLVEVGLDVDVEPPDLDADALGLVGALLAGAARPAVGVGAFCFN